MDDPDLEYAFVTRDASGQTHTIPLPVHGKQHFQYLHIPVRHDLDPSVKIINIMQADFHPDIAFFELTSPLPENIQPAVIAPALASDFREIFVAGYSPLVHKKKDKKDKYDTELSISNAPCYQTRDSKNQALLISTCYVLQGDSGGAEFIINEGKIHITSVINGDWRGGMPKIFGKNKDIRWNSSFDPRRLNSSAPLPQMRNFCLKSMGADYCTGFPENTPIS